MNLKDKFLILGYRGNVSSIKKLEKEAWEVLEMSPSLAKTLAEKDNKSIEEIRQELLEHYAKKRDYEKVRSYNLTMDIQELKQLDNERILEEFKKDYENKRQQINLEEIDQKRADLNNQISELRAEIKEFEASFEGKDRKELLRLMEINQENLDRLDSLHAERYDLLRTRQKAVSKMNKLNDKYERIEAKLLEEKKPKTHREHDKSQKETERSNKKAERDEQYKGKVKKDTHKNYEPETNLPKKITLWEKMRNKFNNSKFGKWIENVLKERAQEKEEENMYGSAENPIPKYENVDTRGEYVQETIVYTKKDKEAIPKDKNSRREPVEAIGDYYPVSAVVAERNDTKAEGMQSKSERAKFLKSLQKGANLTLEQVLAVNKVIEQQQQAAVAKAKLLEDIKGNTTLTQEQLDEISKIMKQKDKSDDGER